jgi:hypothetical protein
MLGSSLKAVQMIFEFTNVFENPPASLAVAGDYAPYLSM